MFVDLLNALEVEDNRIISAVGAGGKSSLIYYLAQELKEKETVIVTTTTKIYYPDLAIVDSLLINDDFRALEARLHFLLSNNKCNSIIVLGQKVVGDKIIGLPCQWIDRLAENRNLKRILIEADGAKRMSFKVPASNEPVIADSTELILLLLGVSVIGKAVGPANIFRFQKLKELFAKLPDKIDAKLIAEALAAEDSYGRLKRDNNQQVIPVINQIDDNSYYQVGLKIAKLLLAKGFDKVILSSLKPEPKLLGVVG